MLPRAMRIKLTKLAKARSSSYPGLLMHPALQLKVMIVEGYHCSQSCQDTPLPINRWPPTVHCVVQMATLQASPSDWIYQATLYNTHSSRIGVATTATVASTTSNEIKQLGHWRSKAYKCYIQPTSILQHKQTFPTSSIASLPIT